MWMPVQIEPGLFRSNTAYDSPNRWWDMNLIRWQSGHMRPIGGCVRLTATPLDSAVRKIHKWRNNSNTPFTLVGTDASLYTDQSTFVNITPSGFSAPGGTGGLSDGYGTGVYGAEDYGDPRESSSPIYQPFTYWSFGNWGEDVIFTASSDGRLYYYDSSAPTTTPTLIATAPTGNNSVLVTEDRHVMVIGSNSGGGTPRRIAWSSREDYTDWNFASTTNSAGFLELPSRTPLTRAVKIRGGLLVFSSSEVFLVTYGGSTVGYTQQLIGDTALMHPDSIATFDGKAVWLSRGGFHVYDGGFVRNLDCPILEDILAEIDPVIGTYKAHASENGIYPEVMFFWARAGDEQATRYAIWGYAENTWAWGTMARSAMCPAGVTPYPVAGDEAGNLYEHENGWTDAGTSRVGDVWVESGALGINSGNRTIEIKQALPTTGHGYDAVNLTFYTKLAAEGAERTFGPYSPRSDGYTDVRVTGRDARIRFTATRDADWSIGQLRLDVAQGTGR